MNFQKPISEQLPKMELPTTQDMQNSVSSSLQNVSSGVANIQSSINNTLNEFSSKSVVGASQEFLNSNSIIAKFVFIILVLIVFMFLANLGIMLIGYFTQPSKTPYLVSGMVDGNSALVISQDPKNTDTAIISRSNNQTTGIEFTWSIWLLITSNKPQSGNPDYFHIFNKGDANYSTLTGLSLVNNGPGLYLKKALTADTSGNILHLVMDTVDGSGNMDITGVPMNKWFHVALRMENKVLDAYINGTIYNRLTLQSVPKQNYQDVLIGQNDGFTGKLSNFRYYNYALSAFEINNIVAAGPNTSTSKLAIGTANTTNAYYLSSKWYNQ